MSSIFCINAIVSLRHAMFSPLSEERVYFAPNVVGTRKLKALIIYTINPLLYEKRSLCVVEPLFGGLGATYADTRAHDSSIVVRSRDVCGKTLSFAAVLFFTGSLTSATANQMYRTTKGSARSTADHMYTTAPILTLIHI